MIPFFVFIFFYEQNCKHEKQNLVLCGVAYYGSSYEWREHSQYECDIKHF